MFSIDIANGVARLQLTRPEKSNALNVDFWSKLQPALEALDQDAQARVLVVTGQGKNFCAGMDLGVFADSTLQTQTPAERERFMWAARALQDALSALEQLRIPVIAVVQGACVGGGLELAAACDVRVMSSEAYFRLDEINIGMMADVGSLQRLPKLLPEPVVKELAFFGRKLEPTRAQALGFVAEVCGSPEAALARGLELAEEVKTKAPLALAASKRMLHYARDHSVSDALEFAAVLQGAVWNPADMMAAAAARATKQPGEYEPLQPRRFP